jgi:LuxR family maltose regulon positive regulatory protein
MSGDLLLTKLTIPPSRPSLVARPHLIERLNQGVLSGSKLTLVSAPAGFGKTTLVAEWLFQSMINNSSLAIEGSSWLSLDKYDDDPNRFWQYLLAALESAIPGIGASTQPLLLTTPLPPPPVLLTGLLNNLADLSQPIVLVIDDYHVIASQPIHEGLDFLLEHAPPQLHLVLMTRADPPLALPRLRARHLLNEIRVADLRFKVAETAVFLREVMDIPLSAGDVAALEARTEGWITGLQLAAISLQGRADTDAFIKSFTGSHHYILEYLAEEVLRQQPAQLQEFLLQTSILAQLCGPLCDAVTGRDDSQNVLAELYRQNLFITPLDEGRRWYRYHQLLAALLDNRLRQIVAPEEIRALHHRASLWCEENGEWETAVSHAIQAALWERAANLIAKAYHSLFTQGRIATWQRWLDQIPAPLVQNRLELRIRQGWATFLNGQVNQAEATLQEARATLLSLPSSRENRALRGELATYLATIAFFHEQAEVIIQTAEEALAFLPPEDLTSRIRATIALGLGVNLAGDTHQAMRRYQEAAKLAGAANHVFLLAHALETVADGHFQMGQLRAAAATCQEIIDLGTQDRSGPLPFAGNGHLKLAAVQTEWRELASAKDHLEKGLALSQQGGIGYNLFEAEFIQVRLCRALGDEPGAMAALRRAEAIFGENQSRIMAIQLATCQVQYWLSKGDVATAAHWAERHPLTGEMIRLEELPLIGQEVQQVLLARVRLAQGRPDDVLAIYDQIHDQAQAVGRMAGVIEMSLLRILALQEKGETDAALDTLRRILILTRPEGHVQVFVESGKVILDLLRQLPADEQNEYVTKLISSYPDPELLTLSPSPSTLVEPLSPRELEVLRLIAAGLSNKQIAAELTVTLNTVKKHTSHVYGKLAVSGRTQAIGRARELRLI